MWKPGAPSHALVIALPLLAAPWSATAQTDKAPAAKVDEAFIRQNEAHSKEWPTYGLDYAETRYSKLEQINDANVKELGLVWSYSLESTRGVEATPLVVDGIMYVTGPWSIVHAVDVRTGKGSGNTIRRCRARSATRRAATWSIAARRCTRARSSSARWTAAWSHRCRHRQEGRGRRTRSSTSPSPTRSPARRASSKAMW